MCLPSWAGGPWASVPGTDSPSPTQDVSSSQGQPRVKGWWAGGGVGPGGDVTAALSNALAEPEAPTLGGRPGQQPAAKSGIRAGHLARSTSDRASWARGLGTRERRPLPGLWKAVSTSDPVPRDPQAGCPSVCPLDKTGGQRPPGPTVWPSDWPTGPTLGDARRLG